MSDVTKRTVRGLQLIHEDTAAELSVLFGELVGCHAGPSVPMIAPAMLLGTPGIRQETLAMTPPDGLGVVHESQVFRCNGPTYPTGRPVIEIAQQVRPMAVLFDFAIAGEEAHAAHMQTRLRFVTREEMAAIRGASFSPRFQTSETVWKTSRPVGIEAVVRYVTLAHDANPIHVDGKVARAVGLSGAVLPGMLLCGLCEFALRDVWPDIWIREIKTRFMASVPVGAAVRFAIVPRKMDADGQLLVARIFVVTEDDMIAAIMDVQSAPKVR